MTSADSNSGSELRAMLRTIDLERGAVRDSNQTSLTTDISVIVGREGELLIGVTPEDTGISRRALTITPTATGWSLLSSNSNGAVLHPWAQPAAWLDPGIAQLSVWPRIAVRLIGSRADLQHWVLLVGDHYEMLGGRDGATPTNTVTPRAPLALTTAQTEALRAVFGPHLQWPPVVGPLPTTLQAAARHLGISEAAIYQRLEAAQNRAYQLGSHRQYGVTEPDYVYVLARHGYLGRPGDPESAAKPT